MHSKQTTELQHDFAWVSAVRRVRQGRAWEGLSGAGTVFAKADQAGRSEEAEFWQRTERRKKAVQAEGTPRTGMRGPEQPDGSRDYDRAREASRSERKTRKTAARVPRGRGCHSRCKGEPKRAVTRWKGQGEGRRGVA